MSGPDPQLNFCSFVFSTLMHVLPHPESVLRKVKVFCFNESVLPHPESDLRKVKVFCFNESALPNPES